MPVTKQAKKKLRKDRKREIKNQVLKAGFKKIVKNTRKSPTVKRLSAAAKVIDKAAKKGIIHKNKAARIKSRLTKLNGSSSPKTKSK
ncbi:MAG: hypothetical protein ACD_37C00133G0002 [uncultured bacterium]|nr:MAG: hypothetical protein ACD_37C00133G0002 [uncultured bacterium]